MRHGPLRRVIVCVGGIVAGSCLLARVAGAQPVPLGPEFQVNTYTTGYQGPSSVAAASDGSFVVAWESPGSAGTDSDGGIQGQRYDANGVAIGGEFQVNTYTTAGQSVPRVGMDTTGNFVVVWRSPDTDVIGVQGQRYDSSGAPVGPEFQVNTYTTSVQNEPSVAVIAGGAFVVVWHSLGGAGSDDGSYSVQARRYDASGTPLGAEFQVNSHTTGTQRSARVAVDGAGRFVVVWQSNGSAGSDTSGYSIQGRRYDALGAPLGGDFEVNTFTTGDQLGADVAIDATGNFVVVWSGSGILPDSQGVQGQRYDATGMPVGTQFLVNTYTTGIQDSASVSADSAGNFVVAWRSAGSAGSDASSVSVQGRRYDASGTPMGAEFQVNTYTTSGQSAPSVAMDASASFVVTWTGGGGQDGAGSGIFAQRYQDPVPTTTSSSTSTSTSTSTTVAPLLILGKKLLVKDPTGAEDGRKVIALAKESATDIGPAIVGDPTVSGATLRVIVNGATPSDQTYVLDATGWKTAGSVGFKYSGPTAGDADPVKKVILKRTPAGTAFLKVLIKGNVGSQSLDVVPPAPGTDGGVVLAIPGGGIYCAVLGGAAGGSVVSDGPTGWIVTNPTAEAGCPLSTSPTTTTTSSTLPSCAMLGAGCGTCGDGICGDHVDPDPPSLVCASSGSCVGLTCANDADCGSGQVCTATGVFCCAPCP